MWGGVDTITDRRVIFFLLCLQGALISFNISSIAGIIPAMSSAFGVPAFTMGIIIVAYMVPYGIAALLYGPLSRVVNTKKVTLCCLCVFSLASFISGVAGSFKLLLSSRIIAGIAASAIIPLSLSLIGYLMPYEKRGKAVGIFFSVIFASSVTGVFLSGLLEWKWMFLVPAFGGVAVVLLALLFFPSIEREHRGFEVHYLTVLFKNEGRSVFAYIFLVAFIYSGIYSWLGVFFADKHGMNQWWISLSLTSLGLGGIVGELVGGVFADRKGRITTAACGLFLLFVTTVGLVYTTSFPVLALLLFLHGLAWTINHSALSTILTDFPSHVRAEATSLNSALRFISGGIGTAVTGFWVARGFSITFTAYACLFLLLALATRTMLTSPLADKAVVQQDIS
jgi:predicted MFS family arabinose efflux permease